MLAVVAPQNMIAARGFDLWMTAENYLFLWGAFTQLFLLDTRSTRLDRRGGNSA